MDEDILVVVLEGPMHEHNCPLMATMDLVSAMEPSDFVFLARTLVSCTCGGVTL